MADIKVYGADWCPMTRATREHLRAVGVEYDYINIEADPAARKWVRDQNDGLEKKPTLDIAGEVLSEPTDEELDDVLASAGIL